MRYYFHNLPFVNPYEYFCTKCKTLNFAMVSLEKCPVCNEIIMIKGKVFELDKEALLKEFSDATSTTKEGL